MIHRDLITARIETRARSDVAFSPADYYNDAIILHVLSCVKKKIILTECEMRLRYRGHERSFVVFA